MPPLAQSTCRTTWRPCAQRPPRQRSTARWSRCPSHPPDGDATARVPAPALAASTAGISTCHLGRRGDQQQAYIERGAFAKTAL
eukprot:14706817-Alexandrium_andersonii.AAC.1